MTEQVNNIEISRQVATECCILMATNLNMKINDQDIAALCEKLVKWIFKKGEAKNTLIKRQAALRRIVMGMECFSLHNSDDILIMAEKAYNYFSYGTWKL